MGEKTISYLSAGDVENIEEVHLRHPLNKNSDVFIKRLAQVTGLQRISVTVARVPPKKESFAYHSHERNEEFIYVLQGRGIAQVGDQEIEVRPGDFLGFAAPGGPGHHMINPFDEDLVYLMGGENNGFDIGYFPKHGKRIIFSNEEIISLEDDDCEFLNWSNWEATKE